MTTLATSVRPVRKVVVRSPVWFLAAFVLAALTTMSVAAWPLWRWEHQQSKVQTLPPGISLIESSSRLADETTYELESTQVEAAQLSAIAVVPGRPATPPFPPRTLMRTPGESGSTTDADAALDALKELHDKTGLIGYTGVRVGWPCRFAIVSTPAFFPTAAQTVLPGTPQHAAWRELVESRRAAAGRALLPVERRIVGGTVNTVFFFVVWGLVLQVVVTGFRSLKVGGRRRRGECIHCRYQRAGIAPIAPCPECGRPNV